MPNITLADGIERELRYTYGSLKLIKKLTGKSVSEVFQSETADVLPVLIYAGLVDRSLTIEDIEPLMLMAKTEAYVEAITKAMGDSSPDPTPANTQKKTVL